MRITIFIFCFFAQYSLHCQQFGMIADINLGIYSSEPSNFTELNGELLFTAYTPADGICVYKSNGSGFGTIMIKDLYPTANTNWQGNSLYWYNFPQGKLFQSLDDRMNKIWFTDGTTVGTYPIFEINDVNPQANICSGLLTLNNNVYFITKEVDNVWGNVIHRFCCANSSFTNVIPLFEWTNTFGQDTWFLLDNIGNYIVLGSEGSSGTGTWSFDINLNVMNQIASDTKVFQSSSKVKYLDKIFYTPYQNQKLYSLDGSINGEVLVFDAPSKHLTLFNGLIYFSGGQTGVGLPGIELYKTDGTLLNTNIACDVYFGYNSSKLQFFCAQNDKLFFQAKTANGNGIHSYSPPNTASSELMTSPYFFFYDDFNVIPKIGFSNKLYFQAPEDPISTPNKWKLWESDGTASGTFLTANINTTSDSSCIGNFFVAGNTLFFTACDDLHGLELWSSQAELNVSDESQGSFLISPNPSLGSFTIQSPVYMNDQLYQIFDQFGRFVQSGILSGQQNEIHITEGAGLYFLKIGNEVTKVQIIN
jgi:ELWxxDGT repeat protein